MRKIKILTASIMTSLMLVLTISFSNGLKANTTYEAIINVDSQTINIEKYASISYEIKGSTVEVKNGEQAYSITNSGSITFNKVSEYEIKAGAEQIDKNIINAGTLTFTKSGSSFNLGGDFGYTFPPEAGFKTTFTNIDKLITNVTVSADSGNINEFKLINQIELKKIDSQLKLTSGSFNLNINNIGVLILNGKTKIKVYEGQELLQEDIYNNVRLDIQKRGSDFVLDSANMSYEINDVLNIKIENIQEEAPSDLRPAISGQEHFASNVDSPTPVADMIKEIKAIDDIDGDISHLIKIESDNFTVNNKKIGTYDVDLSVTDSSGNKSTFKFWVTVADVTGPTGAADLGRKTIGYDKTFNIQTFVDTIVVSDNYYPASEITKTVTKDNYTANKTKLGVYQVEVTLKDPSLNETILRFEIEVKDYLAPVINGTTEYVKSYTTLISLDDILKELSAFDDKDGVIELKIESDTYTGNGNKPSKTPYKIVVSATDRSGNKATKEILITVIDDQAAKWYITNGVTLNLPADTPLTRLQIIELLSKIGSINYSEHALITYNTDTYTSNMGVPGLYTLSFRVKEQNGQQSDYLYAINVFGESGEDTDIVPENPSFVDKVTNHIKENKTTYIVGAIAVVGIAIIVSKVKEQVKKNKRRKR